MRKLTIIGSGAIVLLGAAWAVAAIPTTPAATAKTPLSAVQAFKCLDMGGTVSSSGATPSVVCQTDDSGGHLQVSSGAMPLPTSAPAASVGGGSVDVHVEQHSSSQSASSGNVSVDENSSSSSSRGNVSNTSSSHTSVTIINR